MLLPEPLENVMKSLTQHAWHRCRTSVPEPRSRVGACNLQERGAFGMLRRLQKCGILLAFRLVARRKSLQNSLCFHAATNYANDIEFLVSSTPVDCLYQNVLHHT